MPSLGSSRNRSLHAQAAGSKLDRWWWRIWYLFVSLVLIWLLCYAWLARPGASWTRGWVGWWTADKMASRPFYNFNVFLHPGVEIVRADGNPAFHVGENTAAELGHWGANGEKFTWAGWVRAGTPSGIWPTNFIEIRSAQAPGFDMKIGLENGRPKLLFYARPAEGDRSTVVRLEMGGPEPANPGQWFHLAVTSDPNLQRLIINGRIVAQHR